MLSKATMEFIVYLNAEATRYGSMGLAYLAAAGGMAFSLASGGISITVPVTTAIASGALTVSAGLLSLSVKNAGNVADNALNKDKSDISKLKGIQGGSTKVNYKGKECSVYRGGKNFTVKSSDIKINPQTGNVKTSHGVSLDVDSGAVSKFGGAYKIEFFPKGLKIIQRGMRAEHFEIVPTYEMPLGIFQNLLNQIIVSGPY